MRLVVARLEQMAKGGTALYKILITGLLIYELVKFRYKRGR